MSVKDDSFGIAELQNKMLDALSCLDYLCNEFGLTYWLAGGTCLGALRHEGFIPWDDDLDVYMPRPDYEKLWELVSGTVIQSKYVLCRTDKERNYHHRVMQLVDTTTTFINKRCENEDIEHGVYIDIIPIDAREKTFIGKSRQFINAILFSVYNIQCKQEFNGGKMTHIINFGTSVLLGVIRNPNMRYRIWRNAEKKMINAEWTTADQLIVLTSTFHELLNPFPKTWFDNRQVVFETIKVNIPSGAENYCKTMYGDYMKLPPIEQQKVKHNTVFIDLENSYKKYKGKYYCVKE